MTRPKEGPRAGVRICLADDTERPDTTSDCPDRDQHTPMPSGFLDQMEWAERKLDEGWGQERCPTCGRWAMWVAPGWG